MATLLLLASSLMTLLLAGFVLDGQNFAALLASFFVSSVLALIPVFILGTTVFGNLASVPWRVWQLAGLAMIICLLSFCFWVFGPAGDAWDALKVPAYGAILVVPFLHCWYLKGRLVMKPSVAEEAAGSGLIMNLFTHLRFVVYSFLTWLLFYLIGLPDYYQSWPFWSKVVLVVFVTAIYFPITAYTLRKFWADGAHLRNSFWLALYLTLPLFIYDYLLLAVYFELGIMFVIPYWYLTFFYFSFWLQFPVVALWLQRKEADAVQEGG